MIQSNTTLDILVNGQRVDILDRSSINLRINNVLYNPTEINSKQAEYSFSFNLPTTPNNNKIFDYANELAKLNKFKNVYNCEVYADEILIFNGSLRVQSIKKGFYNVNLVNVKINTVKDIFGDMNMNEIDWKIPFNGTNAINMHNADYNSKVIFPLVSYGVFQKVPKGSEGDYNIYTSKFKIDKYNKWYYESFNPSPNLIELVKRAFKQKGFDVQGDAFQDPVISNLYMSMNIAEDQIPTYNLGNPNLGTIRLTTQFSNYTNKNTGASRNANFLEHKLAFPYLGMGPDVWNFGTVDVYDLWSDENSLILKEDQHYLFDDGNNCIVIPADGLYKVRMVVNASIPLQNITAQEYYIPERGRDAVLHDVQLENTLQKDMPIEIQLMKNSDECELIHGSYQWNYPMGNRQTTETWNTAYPHEKLSSSWNPSVSNAMFSSGGRTTDSNGRHGGRVEHHNRPSNIIHHRPNRDEIFFGHMPKPGELLVYDPWVNSNFVCGVSSMSQGTPSIIKNGYSWNNSVSDKNNARYEETGYWSLTKKGRGTPETWKKTEFNKNTLLESPINSCTVSDKILKGEISGIVELKKNDILALKAVTRHWENVKGNVYYNFDCDVTIEIEAYSPKTIESIDYQGRGWHSPTQFDTELQIGNFLNREVKVSDFIDNFLKEFNLSFVNEGDVVYLNKQQLNVDAAKYAINLDNRVMQSESSLIEYPNSMQVKYKIDTDEWGFETTVPKDKLNEPNWKDFGDYGSDKVIINDRNDAQEESIQLSTSYCWYDTFEVWGDDDVLRGTLRIPVISKFSYMIEEYSYEDSMQFDGKSLPMRYWFRGSDTNLIVNVNGKYPVKLYTVWYDQEGFTLSYKDKENTLLSNYFNINPNLSNNYVSIKCYLNPYEYQLLKNGANVIFDSDVYIVSEIQGYDVMGINQTELLLIKK